MLPGSEWVPKLKLCQESSQSSSVWNRLLGGAHVDGHSRSMPARSQRAGATGRRS